MAARNSYLCSVKESRCANIIYKSIISVLNVTSVKGNGSECRLFWADTKCQPV